MNNNPLSLKFRPFGYQGSITFGNNLAIPPAFLTYEPTLLRFILYRRERNMNTILLVCGNVRTGKSYLGLKIAEEYCRLNNTKFDVNKQCSFDVIPFLKWSQNAVDSVFILDEVGVTLNSQEWFTTQSKIMRNFIQAQGFRRNLLIIVLPNIAFLLKSIRFMINYTIETIQQGKVKWYKMVMRHSLGKGFLSYMGIMKFDLPHADTVLEYEKMKKYWNDKHLKEDLDQLEGLKETTYYTMAKQDLNKALKKGLIDDEKYVNDMTSKGYSKSDANIMLKLAMAKNIMKYHHICTKCDSEWDSRTLSPKKCQFCGSYKWNEQFNNP